MPDIAVSTDGKLKYCRIKTKQNPKKNPKNTPPQKKTTMKKIQHKTPNTNATKITKHLKKGQRMECTMDS